MLGLLLSATMLLTMQAAPRQIAGASIEGVVVRAGTNEPIANAQLALTRTSAPGATTPKPIVQAIRVRTDAQGRFAIAGIEPGAYRLAAARNSFITQEFGERSFNRPGAIIELVAGEVMKDVVFHLTPAGTIAGRLLDASGRLLPCGNVALLRYVYDATGARTLQRVMQGETNDLGEYRLFYIPPGHYYLMGDGRSNSQSCGATDSLETGYAPTYYPGTAVVSEAEVIDVQPGADLHAIDFRLTRLHGVRVRGRLIDAVTAQPPPGERRLILAPLDRVTGASSVSTSYDPATGLFDFQDVMPGAYIVAAFFPPAPPEARNVARVDVANSDIETVVLRINAFVAISGRIQVEGAPALSALPGFDHIGVILASLDSDGKPGALSIASEGVFKVDHVQAGKWRLEVSGLPPDAYVKAARFGGDDILKRSLVVTDSPPGSLDIVIGPNGGAIAGTLVDKDLKPVRDTDIVLVPDGARDRHSSYKTAVSGRDGKFTIRGIPPGDYKIYAWEKLETYAYYDPEVLGKYENQGKPIHIDESATAPVVVEVIPADEVKP